MFATPGAERDLFAELMRLHLSLVILERMTAAFDVFGAEGAGDEQSLRVDSLTEMAQQVRARWIGPVQIFQQKNDWRRCRKYAEHVSHFAHHPFFGSADRFLLQFFQRAARNES